MELFDSGWLLIVDPDGAVWINEGPDIVKGAGICVSTTVDDAIAILSEALRILQHPGVKES